MRIHLIHTLRKSKAQIVAATLTATLLVIPSHAQKNGPGAKTTGNCSPIVHGNRNVIDCGRLSAQDAALLADILNEARSSNKSLSEIKDLLKNALDPYRTVVAYWPDGERIETNNGGGQVFQMWPGEHEAFAQFLTMEREHKWREMISLAETERQKASTWYTVDFFEAEGYASLCNLSDAKDYAEKFIQEVGENPRYDQMVSLARSSVGKLEQGISNPTSFPCQSLTQ